MKHPLTSKERRGLTAVAAAALLCVASGFAFRSCWAAGRGAEAPGVVVVDNDTAGDGTAKAAQGDSISVSPESSRSSKSDKVKGANGKRSRREKRQKAEKVYPTRSPLDEPIDAFGEE